MFAAIAFAHDTRLLSNGILRYRLFEVDSKPEFVWRPTTPGIPSTKPSVSLGEPGISHHKVVHIKL